MFLQNTTGFLVGVEAEQQGQVKHGAKLIQAVANARVPKITLVVGNSYGAGNYAMASRALKPHFVFAWPTARTAVMGGAQAAKVMRIVAEGKLARRGIALDAAMQSALDTQAQRDRRRPRRDQRSAVLQRTPVRRRHHRSARLAQGVAVRARDVLGEQAARPAREYVWSRQTLGVEA